MTNDKMPPAAMNEFGGSALDPQLDAMIGQKLRTFYDDLLSAPVPDRILDLISKLDAKERGGQPGNSQ